MVIILRPLGNGTAGMIEAEEQTLVEQLVPHAPVESERDEQRTAFGVDGTAIAIFLRTSALLASA